MVSQRALEPRIVVNDHIELNRTKICDDRETRISSLLGGNVMVKSCEGSPSMIRGLCNN